LQQVVFWVKDLMMNGWIRFSLQCLFLGKGLLSNMRVDYIESVTVKRKWL